MQYFTCIAIGPGDHRSSAPHHPQLSQMPQPQPGLGIPAGDMVVFSILFYC